MAVRVGPMMDGGGTKPTPATLAQILRSTGATTGEAQRFANIAKAATKTPTTSTNTKPTSTPAPVNLEPLIQQVSYGGGGSSGSGESDKPKETGNVAVDQANVLANILNSPLYTESIKNAYLTQYLPGLTQANYEINKARSQEVQNDFLRRQAQANAIREIAGSYAARGLRTPKMVTEGFAPVQQASELERTAAEQVINDLVAGKEVMYGAGAQDAETFITDPIMFGSVGAGARRSALSELLALPDIYGLTQVANASSAPLANGGTTGGTTRTRGTGRSAVASSEEMVAPVEQPQELPTEQAGAPAMTAAQLQAKIAAANKYINQQKAKNNPKTVAGATKKLQEYETQLAGLGGM